ncbi:GTPase HflX [Jeotgalicoccus huakuii]|nr:GTPase HflX [Jeotgalicoccus huakuii]
MFVIEMTHTGIIIAANLPQTKDIDAEVKELKELSESIGIEILGIHIQNRQRVDRKSYVGSGFLAEIVAQYEDLDYCIVNDEILASQNRAIETMLDTSVIDRTQVILDIFSLRAQSKSGKLQVELAQLEYLVPRLKGEGINLSRLGGGIGTRGPGETKLETDRRHINSRISDIKRQLKVIDNHRLRYRNKRRENQVTKVSLIGYTNAGKSTLFNKLTKAEALEANKLFATLDPLTREMVLPSGFQCIISDTVGFIQKLPTTLIESFKSTLEEAADSDFIIHVIDNNTADINSQYDTVEQLIQSLDMSDIPQLVLFNKSDLNDSKKLLPPVPYNFVNKNMNSTELLSYIEDFMIKYFSDYEVSVPIYRQDKIYNLKRQTVVKDIEIEEETVKISGFEPDGNFVNRIIAKDEDSE